MPHLAKRYKIRFDEQALEFEETFPQALQDILNVEEFLGILHKVNSELNQEAVEISRNVRKWAWVTGIGSLFVVGLVLVPVLYSKTNRQRKTLDAFWQRVRDFLLDANRRTFQKRRLEWKLVEDRRKLRGRDVANPQLAYRIDIIHKLGRGPRALSPTGAVAGPSVPTIDQSEDTSYMDDTVTQSRTRPGRDSKRVAFVSENIGETETEEEEEGGGAGKGAAAGAAAGALGVLAGGLALDEEGDKKKGSNEAHENGPELEDDVFLVGDNLVGATEEDNLVGATEEDSLIGATEEDTLQEDDGEFVLIQDDDEDILATPQLSDRLSSPAPLRNLSPISEQPTLEKLTLEQASDAEPRRLSAIPSEGSWAQDIKDRPSSVASSLIGGVPESERPSEAADNRQSSESDDFLLTPVDRNRFDL